MTRWAKRGSDHPSIGGSGEINPLPQPFADHRRTSQHLGTAEAERDLPDRKFDTQVQAEEATRSLHALRRFVRQARYSPPRYVSQKRNPLARAAPAWPMMMPRRSGRPTNEPMPCRTAY